MNKPTGVVKIAVDENPKASLVKRLFEAQVASCTCLTKSPDWKYHNPLCHYRLCHEAKEEIESLRIETEGHRRNAEYRDKYLTTDYARASYLNNVAPHSIDYEGGWRTATPPLYRSDGKWYNDCMNAVIDALTSEGVVAWPGDGTSCVVQIVESYALLDKRLSENKEIEDGELHSVSRSDEVNAAIDELAELKK